MNKKNLRVVVNHTYRMWLLPDSATYQVIKKENERAEKMLTSGKYNVVAHISREDRDIFYLNKK